MTARRDGAGPFFTTETCCQCDGHGWIGDDLVTGEWSRICPTCNGTGYETIIGGTK